MRTREELENVSLRDMTMKEIGSLDYETWRRKADEARAKEAACTHERVSTASEDMRRRGDHRGHCKHCGMDMSVDSGD